MEVAEEDSDREAAERLAVRRYLDAKTTYFRVGEEARVLQSSEKGWPAVETALRRAVELAGSEVTPAHVVLAEVLYLQRRYKEASAFLREALAADPIPRPEVAHDLAWCVFLEASDPPGFVDPEAPGIDRPEVIEHRPDPQHTSEARDERLNGVVEISGFIDTDGRFRCPRVVRGLRLGMTEAVLGAVRQWRFKPASRAGEPVIASYELTVNFRLR